MHSVLLLLAIGGLLAGCGWIVAGSGGVVWSMAVGTLCLATVRRAPVDVMLAAIRAGPLSFDDGLRLAAPFTVLCRRAGVSPAPRLRRFYSRLPVAFTLGEGDAATIAVADSVLSGLSTRELCGILAHEIVHLRNGDILMMQLGTVLEGLTRVLSQVGIIVVFFRFVIDASPLTQFPILSIVALAAAPTMVGLLRLALSRAREAEADLEAAELTGDPMSLASALAKLREWQYWRLRQLLPLGPILHLPTLLSDHPPTEERIRRLRQIGGRRLGPR